MNEITPDMVAAIATRLLNDVPSADGSALPSPTSPSVPDPASYSSTPMTGAPSAFPEPPVELSTPGNRPYWLPTETPGTMPGFASDQFSVPQLDSLFHQSSQGVPTGNGNVSTDGLRRFVSQIRDPGLQPQSGLCPGSPGVSLLQRLLAPHNPASTAISPSSRPLDIPSIRRDFPALHQQVHGKPLVWFDNAATTQKPQAVIDALAHYYAHDNSNIHRAAHTLAARSTDAFENVREKVQKFLGAATTREIIFVRGTTEGINLVAQTYGKKFLQPGDEIVLSRLEHHANIVPWQMVAKERGAIIRVIPVNDRGEILLEEYQALLGPRTKIVGLTQASNSLGTILPVAEMTQIAKRYGAKVVIDGAQSVSHLPVNVEEIGCDFFVFSGHKIFGPTGIGVVYMREELQELTPPWQGGGNMIKHVTFEETVYADPPNKFEAGTPNIADTVGLGAALDYVQRLGLTNIGQYEHHLLQYATERLLPINGLRIIGQAREKVSVVSFVLKDRRTEEVGKLLDLDGIAVRAGHHCSQPSLQRYGVDATVRPSFAFYNTTDEIDHLVASIKRINTGSVTTSAPSSPTTRLSSGLQEQRAVHRGSHDPFDIRKG